MILAGDLGGTKCTLILFDIDATRLRPVYRLTAKTADFPDISSGHAQVVARFCCPRRSTRFASRNGPGLNYDFALR